MQNIPIRYSHQIFLKFHSWRSCKNAALCSVLCSEVVVLYLGELRNLSFSSFCTVCTNYRHPMRAFFNTHSGLRLNLNLCLFLQTFNAISESEYVKIGSMCIFFLISVIGLSENTTLYIFRVKFKSCFISIRQRLLFTNFPTIFCSQFI